MSCRYLLDSIIHEWRELPPRFQPWGFWVALFAPLARNTDQLPVRRLIDAAWFFDGRRLKVRSPLDYRRFHTIQIERRWYMGMGILYGPDNHLFGRTYEIGLAAIAPFEGTEEWYVETQWAGLWGEGRRVRVDGQGGVRMVDSLWRS